VRGTIPPASARGTLGVPLSAQDIIETAAEPQDWGVSYVGGGSISDVGGYIAPGNPFAVGSVFNPNPFVEPARYQGPPPEIFPTVHVQPPDPTADEDDPEDFGDGTLPYEGVISPYEGTAATVFEGAGIPQSSTAIPADWDWVYENYVREYSGIPPIEGGSDMPAIDWGGVVGGIIGGVWDPLGLGDRAANAYRTGFAATPEEARRAARAGNDIDPITGRRRCRRRRRRRLLTDGDFNDLMRIGTLPNKDIVKIALAKAVGR